LKKDDLEPPLILRLLDGDQWLDLTTAASVKFTMIPIGGDTPKITSATMTVSNQLVKSNHGKVSYTWQGTDTHTVGTYHGIVVVTWPASRVQTFPSFVIAVDALTA